MALPKPPKALLTVLSVPLSRNPSEFYPRIAMSAACSDIRRMSMLGCCSGHRITIRLLRRQNYDEWKLPELQKKYDG
jgi:hypothetical protein